MIYQMARGRKKVKLSEEAEESPESAGIYETPNSESEREEEYEGNASEEGRDEGKRENTLSLLTKRFVRLIKSRENFVLDINEATL